MGFVVRRNGWGLLQGQGHMHRWDHGAGTAQETDGLAGLDKPIQEIDDLSTDIGWDGGGEQGGLAYPPYVAGLASKTLEVV